MRATNDSRRRTSSRVAFQMISTSLRECVVAGDQDSDAVAEQLQKLFLSLA